MLDQQLWDFSHPLKQHKLMTFEILEKIEKKHLSIATLKETSATDIGAWIHHQKMGPIVKRCVDEFPVVDVDVGIQPITRSVLRVRVTIAPMFL